MCALEGRLWVISEKIYWSINPTNSV